MQDKLQNLPTSILESLTVSCTGSTLSLQWVVTLRCGEVLVAGGETCCLSCQGVRRPLESTLHIIDHESGLMGRYFTHGGIDMTCWC